MTRLALAAAAVLFLRVCDPAGPAEPVVGTWGGENAGLIADDTSAHVHIACTFGSIHQGIELDPAGRFEVPGDYVLRAYPVFVGPAHPARFRGTVSGRFMALTVTVTDTIADSTVVLGPVQVERGAEPRMQMCPICRTKQ
ncbi:MAG: hypothetical protein ACREN5_03645 [Gemmatimonadales bacterium]